MIKFALLAALSMGSASAYAQSIAGTWQGPCETRGELSVKFTYVITETTERNGDIAKTKIYYSDAACSVYSRTGQQTVPYTLGTPDENGVYPLDVSHRGQVLYDIVALSDDGNTLIFGDKFSSAAEKRPTELSTSDRVFIKVEN